VSAARFAIALASLAVAACAGPPPGPPPPARVSVEVLRGLAPGSLSTPERDAPVVVILDVTRSMGERTEAGTVRHVAARRAAERFVRGVGEEREIWLYAVGSGDMAQCQPVYRGARSGGPGDRAAVLRELGSLRARGEGSLAAALDGVREELARAGTGPGGRVVVFSDLGPECAGERDLCAAAARLARAGARLDVVAIGARPAPACLAEPEPDALAPPPAPAPPRQRPPSFRVIQREPESLVVGCSDAGGLPVAVSPGPGAVAVALEPPLRVEKIFDPGTHHVLQVLDFPALDPPARKWRWVDTPLPGAPAPVADGEGGS